MTNANKLYRPNAGIMLFNREGKIFVAQRKDLPIDPTAPHLVHAWQMPQGGIDKGEQPGSAAIRELREETSVVSTKLIGEVPKWLSYDFPADLAKKLLKGKYIGQKQKWFAMLFTGEETEINIHQPDGGKHKAEFCAWRWEDLAKLPDLIVPFKREIYLELTNYFADIPQKIRHGEIS